MKQKIVEFLARRTARYITKKRPKIVAVTGSVGKTSTTQAITTVLRQKYTVLTTKGNYNTDIGAIMSIFDEESKTNPVSWLMLCVRIYFKSMGKPQHDVYVLELGTDAPGQIDGFRYLEPDISVITAITPEHMEYFKSLDAVAQEELLVTHFSATSLVNLDMADPKLVAKYAKQNGLVFFGSGQGYDIIYEPKEVGSDIILTLKNRQLKTTSKFAARHSLYAALAAASVADLLELTDRQITEGVAVIEAMPGRMSFLNGMNNTVIIDDTYNASPEAVKAALDTLYARPAKKRIALLGMMNELGEHSEKSHREIGEYCDPTKLDLLVTLGKDANSYIAAAAKAKGCVVVETTSPVEAGNILKQHLEEGTVLLAKGSQNGVYAEEAVKLLLADPKDAEKLVRQKSYWPAKKRKQFPDIAK